MRTFARSEPGEPFELEIEQDDGCRVTISGEFDLRCARRLEALVNGLRDVGEGGVVLDLTGVSFIDSSGVRAILALEARSRRQGFDFAIVPGGGQVERVLRVTGIDRGVRLIDPSASGGTRSEMRAEGLEPPRD